MERKRKKRMIITGFAIFAVLALAVVFFGGVIGVSADNIENDARKSQRISEWDSFGTSNEGIAAFIFYNATHDDHTFSLYLNRDGFSFGYFFSEGGSSSIITNGILMLDYGSSGSAIFSMNKDRVAKIEYEAGDDVIEFSIDPSRPFAVVLPKSCSSVALYSDSGNDVSITSVEGRG